MTVGIEYYAGSDVSLDRTDVRMVASMSIDLRAQTGDPSMPADESRLVDPGTFTLSVCGPLPGEHPIGEIRFWYPPANREVRLVGHLTGRPGIMELTPDHLAASIQDDAYRKGMLQWLGVAA